MWVNSWQEIQEYIYIASSIVWWEDNLSAIISFVSTTVILLVSNIISPILWKGDFERVEVITRQNTEIKPTPNIEPKKKQQSNIKNSLNPIIEQKMKEASDREQLAMQMQNEYHQAKFKYRHWK